MGRLFFGPLLTIPTEPRVISASIEAILACAKLILGKAALDDSRQMRPRQGQGP